MSALQQGGGFGAFRVCERGEGGSGWGWGCEGEDEGAGARGGVGEVAPEEGCGGGVRVFRGEGWWGMRGVRRLGVGAVGVGCDRARGCGVPCRGGVWRCFRGRRHEMPDVREMDNSDEFVVVHVVGVFGVRLLVEAGVRGEPRDVQLLEGRGLGGGAGGIPGDFLVGGDMMEGMTDLGGFCEGCAWFRDRDLRNEVFGVCDRACAGGSCRVPKGCLAVTEEVVRLCHACYMKALPAARWLVQDGVEVPCERCGSTCGTAKVGLLAARQDGWTR